MPKIITVQGLTAKQIKRFNDYLIIANNEQLKAMFKETEQHINQRGLI